MKIGDSVLLSLIIYSYEVCKIAYARYNRNGLNNPQGHKKYNLQYGEVRKDVLRPLYGA